MIFSSPEFIFIFLPVTALFFVLFSRYSSNFISLSFLVLASFYFYRSSPFGNIAILCGSILLNFCLGKLLSDTAPFTNLSRFTRKGILALGIFCNLSLLCYYKYIDFIIVNINTTANANLPLLQLALPLAISFFTFQQIGYLVDSYLGKIKNSQLLHYFFFISFFPQLIAGPILRYNKISPQFNAVGSVRINWENIAQGVTIFGLGLFKKVIIANSFAATVNQGFKNPQNLDFFQAWATSLGYTFQLYYDFSAYSDMAIGCALLFNIRLPINFDSPYKALSIQDFWQRWHITLSHWLRDYLYIPLGGNRKGYSRTLSNLGVTFLIAGIWHGAGWTFIVWGLLHGSAMVAHRLWQSCNIQLPKFCSWLLTFAFINIAWVFFRAPHISEALEIIKAMFSFKIVPPVFLEKLLSFTQYNDHIALLSLQGPVVVTLCLLFTVFLVPFATFFGPNSMQITQFKPYNGWLRIKKNFLSALLLSLVLFCSFLSFIGKVSVGKFIYFNF